MFDKYFGPKRLADYEAAKSLTAGAWSFVSDSSLACSVEALIAAIERHSDHNIELAGRFSWAITERDEALGRLAEIAAMETPGAAHAAKRMAAVARGEKREAADA